MSNIFVKLRASMGDVAAKHRVLTAKISELQMLREQVLNAPLPKGDYIKFLHQVVDDHGKAHVKRMWLRVESEGYRGPMNENIGIDGNKGVTWPLLAPWTGAGQVHPSIESILFLCAPILKDGINRAIDAMQWPPEPGLPIEERRREIARIDEELSTLKGELAELQQIVNEVKAL